MTGILHYGDNLRVLAENNIRDESVDLIYLDPPFNSNANYNILFKSPEGKGSHAQIDAFEDTWHWSDDAEFAFDAVINGEHSQLSILLRAMRSALGENDMMAYIAMMAVRLMHLRRVLKPTGSLYLHCDPTASHYLKLLLDGIFGAANFRNEIIWKRTSAHNSAKRWGPVHDVILFYSASDKYTWNKVYQAYDEGYTDAFYRHKAEDGRMFRIGDLTGAGIRNGESGMPWRGVNPTDKGRHWAPPRKFPDGEDVPKTTIAALDYLDSIGRIHWPKKNGVPGFKRYLEDMMGVKIQDTIDDIPPVSAHGNERLGYPTQKPVSLMERIIQASSNEGDIVLDPFCGCGTTVHASEKLKRHWIGIDITHLAIMLIERRLKESFPGIEYKVHGTPEDADSARQLAKEDKYEFQKWIVPRIGGQLYKGGQKGMDRGVDGYLHFRDADKKPQFAIISVKGGKNISSPMIRDLKATVDRENAKLGIFLTLEEVSREMTREAAAAGIYETGGQKIPKIQILTVADIMSGRQPQVPFGHTEGFKAAKREERAVQGNLLDPLSRASRRA